MKLSVPLAKKVKKESRDERYKYLVKARSYSLYTSPKKVKKTYEIISDDEQYGEEEPHNAEHGTSQYIVLPPHIMYAKTTHVLGCFPGLLMFVV